jgi:hypothetical protein
LSQGSGPGSARLAKYLLSLVFGVLPKYTHTKLLLTQQALAACPWLKNQ